MSGFDLSTFDVQSDGEWMTVMHPVSGVALTAADGTAFRIKLVGQDSDEFRSAARRNTDRKLRARGKAAKLSADDIDSDAREILVACTKGWEGVYHNGAALECTPANVRMVYSSYPFIREQADEFISDRANFFRD